MKKARWSIFFLPLALSFFIVEGDFSYRILRSVARRLMGRTNKSSGND